MITHKWDKRFMILAEFAATWSKDVNKQVGAVLVSPDMRQFALGYNGLPRGVDGEHLGEKFTKNEVSIHAEVNAMLNAAVDLKGWTLYVTEAPCLSCGCMILQKQLDRVVCPPINPKSSWQESQQKAKLVFTPQVSLTVLEEEE